MNQSFSVVALLKAISKFLHAKVKTWNPELGAWHWLLIIDYWQGISRVYSINISPTTVHIPSISHVPMLSDPQCLSTRVLERDRWVQQRIFPSRFMQCLMIETIPFHPVRTPIVLCDLFRDADSSAIATLPIGYVQLVKEPFLAVWTGFRIHANIALPRGFRILVAYVLLQTLSRGRIWTTFPCVIEIGAFEPKWLQMQTYLLIMESAVCYS